MNTIIRAVAPLALLASAFVAGDAQAASKTRITDASAKGYVAKAVQADRGHAWSVSLSKGAGSRKEFVANVNWGNRPHPALAVPSVYGSVEMKKGKGAPAGVARVWIRRLMPM